MSNPLEELRKLNNELDEKINDENQPVFTDMICYVRSANISALNQELVRRDLSEMVLSAQSRGETIADVIGGDFKEFCDEVIGNLPPKTAKEKWIDRLDIVFACIPILGAISIISSNDFRNMAANIVSKQPVNYNMGVSIGMIISVLIIILAAFFIVDRITKHALKKESGSNRTKQAIAGGVIGAVLVALFLITWKLGNQIVFHVNIFLAMAVLAGLFMAHKVLNRV